MIDTSSRHVIKSLSKETSINISDKRAEMSLLTESKSRRSLALELRDVQFMYATRPDQIVIKGLSLEVMPSCITAICGRCVSGCAKLYFILYDNKLFKI